MIKSVSRFYRILQVILQYGLDEALPKTTFTRPIRCGRKLLFWLRNQHQDKIYGLRLRLALQE